MKTLLRTLVLALLAGALLAGCADYTEDTGEHTNPLDPDNPDAINQPPDQPGTPTPSDGAAAVSLETLLGWVASDPDGDTLAYDVYFGTTADPPLLEQELATNSTDPGDLSNGTTYRWRVVAVDTYDFTTSSPVWSFTTAAAGNQPPGPPFDPVPEDGAEDVSTSPVLNWSCVDPEGSALTYDVHFGTESPPPLQGEDLNQASFTPGQLAGDALYYWQVVARDDQDQETQGPVWSFRTIAAGSGNAHPEAPSSPIPANGALDVSLPLQLAWASGDPDGDAVTFDVYFGSGALPALLEQDLGASTLAPPRVVFNTTYTWRVVARDEHGLVSSGPTWSFTTVDNEGQTPFTPVAETGQPYTVIVRLDDGGESLAVGDQIALYDDSLCVGAATVDGNWPLVVTAWEADPDHSLPGFTPGEPIRYAVWLRGANVLATPLVNTTEGNGSFGTAPYTSVELTIPSP